MRITYLYISPKNFEVKIVEQANTGKYFLLNILDHCVVSIWAKLRGAEHPRHHAPKRKVLESTNTEGGGVNQFSTNNINF